MTSVAVSQTGRPVGTPSTARSALAGTGQIAVVVTAHNYGQYVAECLLSLTTQTRLPAQVVVIDDGSTDDTPAVLARLVPELSRFFAIDVVRHSEAQGVAASMNEGIRLTTTEFVVNVDADDVCRPNYLASMWEALLATPEASYAYPRLHLFGAESGTFRTFPFEGGRLLFEGNYIPNVALMRRSAFDETYGYRQLRTHVDWDFWLTLLENGRTGVLVDEVLYDWRRHEGAMTYQPRAVRLKARASVLWTHRKLVLRQWQALVPWTWQGLSRRLRARTGEVRSSSGWLDA